jgi:histidinol-phosphate aminotransferase
VRNAFDVNALAQAAAVASLADAPEHLPPRIAMAREGRARLADGLRALGLHPLPSEANFVFTDVGEERARALDTALTARGVIVRPAGAFGAPGALRITVGTPDEVDRVLVAMAEALEETA